MNVLFYSNWYPSEKHPYLGIFVKKHAVSVKQCAINVHIFSFILFPSKAIFKKSQSDFVDEFGMTNTQIIIESRFYKLIHILPFIQKKIVSKSFDKVIREFKPDLLHSNIIYPAALVAFDLSRKYHLPHVITEHWTKIDRFMNSSLFAKKAKKVYQQASKITAVSLFLKKNIEDYNSAGNVIRIPNVIDLQVFNYKEKKQKSGQLVFTCVAQWNYPKRLDLIMQSLEQLATEKKQAVKIQVVGNGAMADQYKTMKWNIDTVFYKNIPPAQIADLIHASDFFIHASDIETFSVVIAEALSTGTPVIASNNTAIVELINDGNGVLCENDLASWNKGLKQLISKNYNHKEIAKQCDRFSSDKIGKQFEEIYHQILKS